MCLSSKLAHVTHSVLCLLKVLGYFETFKFCSGNHSYLWRSAAKYARFISVHSGKLFSVLIQKPCGIARFKSTSRTDSMYRAYEQCVVFPLITLHIQRM